nr:DNA polymerase III subunit gamma/tau [bacterium]
MAGLALYRQMRPTTFAAVYGQEAVVRALINQVQSGQISHAYLFCGPRGTGKTSIARILARAINCLEPVEGEPCGHCANCQALLDDRCTDLIEIDAASNNGVDEMRELRDKVRFAPVSLRYKVYIIDEVHMLSTGAFNALLKTLEEPPSHAVFILATTESHKLPATVISRCQRYDFKRIPMDEIMQCVKKAIDARQGEVEPEALRIIARAADGAMRDALSMAEQALITENGHITAAGVAEILGGADPGERFKWVDCLLQGDAAGVLSLLDGFIAAGRDPAVLARELALHIRGVMIAGAVGDAAAALLEETPDIAVAYARQAKAASPATLCAMLDELARLEGDMRWSSQPRLLLELALMKACYGGGQDVTALLTRLERLEKRIDSGAVAAPASAASPGKPARANPPAQEQPAAAPAPAQPAAGKIDDALWSRVLARLKKEKMPLWAALSAGKFAGVADGQFCVRFEGDNATFAGVTLREASKAAIEGIVAQEAGRPLRLTVEQVGAGRPAAPRQDALLQSAADLFGRENVIVRGDEPPFPTQE